MNILYIYSYGACHMPYCSFISTMFDTVAVTFSMLKVFGQNVDLSCERACSSVKINYTCTVTGVTMFGPILEWAVIRLDDLKAARFIFNERSDVNVPFSSSQNPTWPFEPLFYLTEVSEGNTSTNLTSVVELINTPDAESYEVECRCDTCSSTPEIQSCIVSLVGTYICSMHAN